MRMSTRIKHFGSPSLSPHSTSQNEQIKQRTLQIVQLFFKDAYCRNYSLSLWDGTLLPAREHEYFTVYLKTPFALRAAMMPTLHIDPIERSLNPGRAFIENFFDVRGDLEIAFNTITQAFNNCSKRDALKLFVSLLRLPRVSYTSQDRLRKRQGLRQSHARRNIATIESHYDQPVEFFRTFLDSELVYSCAYFDEEAHTFDQAQLAKLDHVLAKLRIAPGERFLDVGCGWGGLIIRAAERYGAVAHGITLSRVQYEEVRRRIAERNLADRVTVELRDYRAIPADSYDKISSIEMLEHVGREQLAAYCSAVYRALRPGGLFLNQCITDQSPKRQGVRAGGFIGRYVFPDGDLLPISTIVAAAERAGFEVRDVESLREHYTRTCRAWVAALESGAAEAAATTSERTVRIWKLYMACSILGFADGRLGIFQALLERPRSDGKSNLPLTRRDLYISESSSTYAI
jgi:cyclopropane-fatty-acyl-phospholipid synthase